MSSYEGAKRKHSPSRIRPLPSSGRGPACPACGTGRDRSLVAGDHGGARTRGGGGGVGGVGGDHHALAPSAGNPGTGRGRAPAHRRTLPRGSASHVCCHAAGGGGLAGRVRHLAARATGPGLARGFGAEAALRGAPAGPTFFGLSRLCPAHQEAGSVGLVNVKPATCNLRTSFAGCANRPWPGCRRCRWRPLLRKAWLGDCADPTRCPPRTAPSGCSR
jgi:hypothetical protein